MIQLDSRYNAKLDNDLLKRLRDLLGEENVAVKVKNFCSKKELVVDKEKDYRNP